MRDEPVFKDKNEAKRDQILEDWPIKEDKRCTNDALIITELLRDYDKHKIPGGNNVRVSVEVSLYRICISLIECRSKIPERYKANISFYSRFS